MKKKREEEENGRETQTGRVWREREWRRRRGEEEKEGDE
jgi:hypothetical protein